MMPKATTSYHSNDQNVTNESIDAMMPKAKTFYHIYDQNVTNESNGKYDAKS